MKKTLQLIVLFMSISVVAQKDTIMNGKVVSTSKMLEDIHVINLRTKEGEITTRGGYFKIKAQVNDTIMFSAVNLKGYQHIVTATNLQKTLTFIPMEAVLNKMEEVTISEYKSISAESLGIVPKGQVRYTVAERRLNGAEKFKWYSPLLIPFGGMSVDGLVNAISGRTAGLKMSLDVERKLSLQETSLVYFDEVYMKETLKIPEEYVNGFVFYIIENNEYTNSLRSKNRVLASFLITQLAEKYLIQIKPELDKLKLDTESKELPKEEKSN